MKTDAELKEIARQIYRGEIFCSDNLKRKDMHMMGAVLLPLLLMPRDMLEDLLEKNIHMFYEEMSRALQKGINEYPVFGSMKFLTEDEYRVVVATLKQLTEAENKIITGDK